MNYWRFTMISKVAHKIRMIESGQSYVEEGLPDSSKDMIKRRKAQR